MRALPRWGTTVLGAVVLGVVLAVDLGLCVGVYLRHEARRIKASIKKRRGKEGEGGEKGAIKTV